MMNTLKRLIKSKQKLTRKQISLLLAILIVVDVAFYVLPVLVSHANQNDEEVENANGNNNQVMQEDSEIGQPIATEPQPNEKMQQQEKKTSEIKKESLSPGKLEKKQAEAKIASTTKRQQISAKMVKSQKVKNAKTGYYSLSAYNSEASQTDASPCVTANGFNVCKHGVEDTVAANFLPFGTKIKIPELFGDKVFVVRDRMNSRYQAHVDIWFKSKDKAIKFGRKTAKIEVLGS